MRISRWGFHSPVFGYFISEKFNLQTILEGNLSTYYMAIDKTIHIFYNPSFLKIKIHFLIIFLISTKIPKKFLVQSIKVGIISITFLGALILV